MREETYTPVSDRVKHFTRGYDDAYLFDGEEVKVINRGLRFVGRTKCGHILKVDRHTVNDPIYRQTEYEVKFFTSGDIKPQDRRFFPKLLDHGVMVQLHNHFHWLLQEEVPLVKEWSPTRRQRDQIRRLQERYGLADMSFPGPRSYCSGRYDAHNITVSANGDILVFDAGVNKYTGISDEYSPCVK